MTVNASTDRRSRPLTPAQIAQLNNRNARGQFRSKTQGESAALLGTFDYTPRGNADDADARASWVKSRTELLKKAKYVPAVTQVAQVRADSRAGIDKWWAQALAGGSYGNKATVHRMPDDYTPKGSYGHAASGARRTHRMKYVGGKYTIRMPSKTAVNRFAKEVGTDIFEFPAQIEVRGGRSLMVNVQASRQPNGEFATMIVGNRPTDEKGRPIANFNAMAEAVGAILEGRRPHVALKDEALLERARDRHIRAGAKIHKAAVYAEGVEGFGAIRGTDIVLTKFRRPNKDGTTPVYAHHSTVASSLGNLLATQNPTTVWNKQIRAKGEPMGRAALCETCGNYYPESFKHYCTQGYTRGTVERTDHFERTKRQIAVKNIAKAFGIRPRRKPKTQEK